MTAIKLKDRGQAVINNSFLVTSVANVLIALSGFILYSDKVLSWLNISLGVPEKWAAVGMDFETYVWFLSQTISPMILMFGASLKPKNLMYAVPVYCYMLQLYWILMDYKIVNDDHLLQVYVIGTSVLVLAALWGMKWALYKSVGNQIEKAKQKILKNE